MMNAHNASLGIGSSTSRGFGTPPPSSVLRHALLICVLSLAIRLPWAALAQVTPISDFAGYDSLARKWLTTGEFGFANGRAYRTPGYPGFLAAIYWVSGYSTRTAQIAQAVLGAVTSGLIVLLASRLIGPRSAALAGLLHAMWPTSLAYVPVLASENLAVPFVLLTLLAATWEKESLRRRCAATGAAGLCFGILLLVRPAALFFLPAIALLAIWEPSSKRWRLRPAIVWVAVLGLTLWPWFVRNYRLGLGLPTLSTAGGINLWMGNHAEARHGGYRGGYPAAQAEGFPKGEVEAHRALKAAAMRWIVGHPWRYLTLCGQRAKRLLGTTADPWAAKWLYPVAGNDDAVVAAYRDKRSASQPADLLARARALQVRHGRMLTEFRAVAAPLMLTALILGMLHYRKFGVVVLPALSYAIGTSATFMQERFRELWDPLLLIPLAGLLADIISGTANLPPYSRLGRWIKLTMGALALTVSITALRGP